MKNKFGASGGDSSKGPELLATVAPTLLPTKLEIRESVTVYNPQRVVRQLGYDQGADDLGGVGNLENLGCRSKIYWRGGNSRSSRA